MRSRLRASRAEILATQDALGGCAIHADCLPQRSEQLRSLESAVQADSAELAAREGTVRRHQLIVRVAGYVFFVVAGGLVAGLLSDNYNAPNVTSEIQAIVIGGSWIAVLSGIFSRKRTQLVKEAIRSVEDTDKAASANEREAKRLRDLVERWQRTQGRAVREAADKGHADRSSEVGKLKEQADRVVSSSRKLRAEIDEDRRRCQRVSPLARA